MKTPGSRALRKGRLSAPGARYLITKDVVESGSQILVEGGNPGFLIDWFSTAQRRVWFDLMAFVVMPDHYHLVLALGEILSLSEAIGKVNENPARLIRRAAGLPRSFWQDGFHDHLIRPTEDVRKYIEYVHMNPVEANLVLKPEDWPFSSANIEHADRIHKAGFESQGLLQQVD
jgi:putative transposase